MLRGPTGIGEVADMINHGFPFSLHVFPSNLIVNSVNDPGSHRLRSRVNVRGGNFAVLAVT